MDGRKAVISVALIIAMMAFVSCTHGVEDPVKTKSFQDFVRSIAAGRKPIGLAPIMQNALTPIDVSQIRNEFATFGEFESLQFVGMDHRGGYTRYFYLVRFSHRKQGVMFVLDSHQRIAGFFLR